MGNASTTRRRLLGGFAGLGAAAGMFGHRVRGQGADPSATPSPISCIPSAGATASPVVPWASPPATGQIHVVLVVTPCVELTLADLGPIAQVLDTQVQRDFRQFWDIDVKVDVVDPNHPDPDAWLIKFVSRDYGEATCLVPSPVANPDDKRNGHGFCTHGDGQRHPYAWVYHNAGDGGLAHAASHECLEMLANPFVDIKHTAPAPPCLTGNALYLQEVCDPCPNQDACYSIDGYTVSNFVTPAYFDSSNRGMSGVRYDFLEQIANPLEPVLYGNQNFALTSDNVWNFAIWNGATCPDLMPITGFTGAGVSDCGQL